jgi:hypothetical protein
MTTLSYLFVGDEMIGFDKGELRVVVPVGFLLSEEQEVSVSVARPDGGYLPIRLCLIPAQSMEANGSVGAATGNPRTGNPRAVSWPRRHLQDNDGYHGYDMGGGD